MIHIQSPGRICLFGEHQDYLALPVISMAISLHLTIKGQRNKDREVIIHKLDLNEIETFSLDDLQYDKKRDYYKSGIRTCIEAGLKFSKGFQLAVQSNIPIQAGCASSSSLMVAWICFLTKMADNPVQWSLEKIGRLAHIAEVIELDEPGGMMDQYSSAMGGLIYLQNTQAISIESLKSSLASFIIGDSNEKKSTLNILSRCKNLRLEIVKMLEKKIPSFDLSKCYLDEIKSCLTQDEIFIMEGTLKNRDLLQEALRALKENELDHARFGGLLVKEHEILRDVLNVSTTKIEKMLSAALNAGALGGKITGSGGGGCMFVYVTENEESVMEAIKSAGGKAYKVHQESGVEVA